MIRKFRLAATTTCAMTVLGSLTLVAPLARAASSTQPTFVTQRLGSVFGGHSTVAPGSGGTFVANHSYSGTTTVFRVVGGAYSQVAQSATTSADAVLGDVNGDGIPDLVEAIAGSGGGQDEVKVSLGGLDGSFSASTATYVGTTGIAALAVGDLNGDGHDEIVAASAVSSVVSLRVITTSEANGFFSLTAGSPVTVPSLTRVGSFTLADVTGDGVPDALLTGTTTANANPAALVELRTVAGTPSTTGYSSVAADYATAGIAVGDLNGDGRPDVLFESPGSGVGVRYGQPGGTLGATVTLAGFPVGNVVGLGVGDLNGDGIADVVEASTAGGGGVEVALGGPSGVGAPSVIAGSASSGSANGPVPVADLDGDGRPDILDADNGFVLTNTSAATASGPGTASLGSQQVATTGAPVTVTFTVGGAAPLTRAVVTTGGPAASDVIVSHDGCADAAVPVGGTCTVTLRFAPSGVGAESATLSLTASDLPSPAVVSLTGSGTPAPTVAGPAGPAGPAGTPGPVTVVAAHYLAVQTPAKTVVGASVTALVASSASGSAVIHTMKGKKVVATRTVSLHSGLHTVTLAKAPKTPGSYGLSITLMVSKKAVATATTSVKVIAKPKAKGAKR